MHLLTCELGEVLYVVVDESGVIKKMKRIGLERGVIILQVKYFIYNEQE